MIQKIKVYKENGTLIGVLPSGCRSGVVGGEKVYKAKNPIDARLAPFRLALKKAQMKGFRKKEIFDAVQEEFINEYKDLITADDFKALMKKEINRRHQKLKRYRRKVEWFTPNWFVTFTYDSSKCDEATFENKLLHAISNFACRRGWKAIGAAERGKETDRLHYHFMMYIPEGEMVGELFGDYHWDEKRKKREYFTNNTYFHERFGDADFKSVTLEDKINGNISNYLVKYITKNDGHIYYSRGLDTEKEIEVDLDSDVFLTYVEHSHIKVVLGLHVNTTSDKLQELGVNKWFVLDGEGMGFDLDSLHKAKKCA